MQPILVGRIEYTFDHLLGSIGEFVWTFKGEKAPRKVRTLVRYGNHCYSKAIEPADRTSEHYVIGESPLRVFCPIRYSHTFRLTEMISSLLAKPVTTVALTERDNWHIFEIYTKINKTERYCIFFHLKPRNDEVEDDEVALDLVVESAYIKDVRVGVIKRVPFGTAAILTWKEVKRF